MGTCTCGVKPEEHLSKEVLSMHHYWYMHNGFVEGCSYCETAAQHRAQSVFASISEQIDRTVKEIASASGVPADKLGVQSDACLRCAGKGYFMIGSDECKCLDCNGTGICR